MSEITISWKKLTRVLPKSRKYADERATSIDIIRQICGHPDRRIKGIVYAMASSGIRLVHGKPKMFNVKLLNSIIYF